MSIINVLAVTKLGGQTSEKVYTFTGDDARGKAARFIVRAGMANSVVNAALGRAGLQAAETNYLVEEV